MTSPKISIALCTCNGQKFLPDQLNSILTQSALVHEIILCDDASTDNTIDILRDFLTRNSQLATRNFMIHQNPTRLGITKNFEKAISLTTGDVIFLSDQDDVWHKDKIARILPHFQNPDIALVFSNANIVHEDLSPAGYDLWNSIWFTKKEQQLINSGNPLPPLLRHAIAAGATLAFRASYKPLLLPFPDLPHCHDIWITLLLACVARIHALNENLIDYRLHSTNEVGMKHHNLLSQLRMAKWQLNFNAFQYAASLQQAALERLQHSTFNVQCSMFSLLNEKISHSQLRHTLPKKFLPRIPMILHELRTGAYHKYSYGYKSLLQDLFLR